MNKNNEKAKRKTLYKIIKSHVSDMVTEFKETATDNAAEMDVDLKIINPNLKQMQEDIVAVQKKLAKDSKYRKEDIKETWKMAISQIKGAFTNDKESLTSEEDEFFASLNSMNFDDDDFDLGLESVESLALTGVVTGDYMSGPIVTTEITEYEEEVQRDFSFYNYKRLCAFTLLDIISYGDCADEELAKIAQSVNSDFTNTTKLLLEYENSDIHNFVEVEDNNPDELTELLHEIEEGVNNSNLSISNESVDEPETNPLSEMIYTAEDEERDIDTVEEMVRFADEVENHTNDVDGFDRLDFVKTTATDINTILADKIAGESVSNPNIHAICETVDFIRTKVLGDDIILPEIRSLMNLGWTHTHATMVYNMFILNLVKEEELNNLFELSTKLNNIK